MHLQRKCWSAPSGQWRPHEKDLQFKLPAPKCQMGQCILDQTYWKTGGAAPQHASPPPPGVSDWCSHPKKLRRHHLNAPNNFHYNGAFVRLHAVLVSLCNGGLLFPICKWCFFLQEYGLWSRLSEWVWFKYLVGEGARGLKFWNVIFPRNHPWIAQWRQF